MQLHGSTFISQLNYGAFQLRLLNNTFVNTTSRTTLAPEVSLSGVNARTMFLNNIVETQADGLACSLSGSAADGPPITSDNTVSSPGVAYGSVCAADAAHGNITGDPGLSLDSRGNYVPVSASDTGNNSVLPQPLFDLEDKLRVQSGALLAAIDRGAIETPGLAGVTSKIIVAPSRFETGSGQQLVVSAAMIDSDLLGSANTAIDLYLDGNVAAQATINSPGMVQFSPVSLTPGTHEIYAVTHGNTALPAAEAIHVRVNGGSGPSTVAGGSLAFKVSNSNPTSGSSVTLTVTMDGQAAPETGTLRVFDNGILLQASTFNTANTFQYVLAHTAGTHLLAADYQGSFASSAVQAVTYPMPVDPETFTLTAQPGPSTYGQPVTLNASLSPYDSTISKTRLQITEGSTAYLDTPLDSTGAAHATIATLTPGVHTIKGSLSYTVSGSSNGFTFTGTSGISRTIQQTVLAATTALSLDTSPTSAVSGTSISFKAALSSPYTGAAASGGINFRDGSTVLRREALKGNVATLTLNTLAVGAHSITASYDGDTNFQAGTSAPVSVAITAAPPTPDFKLTSDTNNLSLTVQAQHHKSTTLRLTSDNGFDGAVRLACSALPDVASCSFNATSYTLHATNSLPITFTFETSGIPGYLSRSETYISPWSTAAKVLAILFPLPLLFRKRYARLALLLLMASATIAMTACSGKYPDHTPPGTYTITLNVTGVSAGKTVTHAVPFVVTVTP